jgi:hypothetical protein
MFDGIIFRKFPPTLSPNIPSQMSIIRELRRGNELGGDHLQSSPLFLFKIAAIIY